MMERSLYNGVLAGLGIDGKSFFYHNPLASDGSHHRVSWPWWCPCCPANLSRLILSFSGYLYSSGSKAIAIHHYVSSEASFSINGQEARLSQTRISRLKVLPRFGSRKRPALRLKFCSGFPDGLATIISRSTARKVCRRLLPGMQ